MSANEWDLLGEAHQRKFLSEGRASAPILQEEAKAEVIRLTKLPRRARLPLLHALYLLQYYNEKLADITLPQGKGQSGLTIMELEKLLAIGE